jgi:hypothetical protein
MERRSERGKESGREGDGWREAEGEEAPQICKQVNKEHVCVDVSVYS